MLSLNTEYLEFLSEIKQNYQNSQLKAVYSVNQHMIQFYWQMGRQILEKQKKTKWGTKLLIQLATDLRALFPESKGFSVSNLERMRKFALYYPNEISAQAVRELPWGHIILLIEQIKDPDAREWYATHAIKNGLSRNRLTLQIQQNLYSRQGKQTHKISNFSERLPSPQSDLALQLFKDPYDFRFLPLNESAQEQEIETSLVSNLSQVFLELGTGFAYMGNQYKITVDSKDFYFDMLFYHVKLNCYIIVELKAGEFKPEHLGQLNFYLSVADDLLRKPGDNPCIGLLLCKKKSKLIAEYALKRTDGPIGIADYCLHNTLPKELISALPSVETLEYKLSIKTTSNIIN